MKKNLLFIVGMLMTTCSIFAQNNVQFNIYAKLTEADFAMNTTATNNLNNPFKYTRLEYYISEISIVHDGGQETSIADTWILVDAAEQTSVDLGSHNVTNVEAVNFYIGVDPDHNHLDPATYPNTHPLAPKSPSMHWGWTAGYRFAAIEGTGGSSNQLFQLHGLGDTNYKKTTVPVVATATNGNVVIELNADYARVLENIDVSNGVIVHGENEEAQTSLKNFKDYVFSDANGVVSTIDFSEVKDFSVFPNPTNGMVNFLIESNENFAYHIRISDVLGREIQVLQNVKSNISTTINMDNAGLYLVILMKEGQPILTEKLMVK